MSSAAAVLTTIALLAFGTSDAQPQPAGPTGPGGMFDRWGAGDPPTTVWLGVDGEPLPFRSAVEVVEFLSAAKILSVEKILKGSTRPRKVLLEFDGIRAHAIFRDVDISETWVKLDDGSFHMKLRDYDLFEVAAFRMAEVLGLDNVPPTVVRRFGGATGSLQIWLENIISSGDLKDGLSPPDYAAWAAQRQAMELFDYLILNIDRNTGNYLVDADWKLWMIDHTRAFQTTEPDSAPVNIVRCAPLTWSILLSLDGTILRPVYAGLLTDTEIAHVLERVYRLRAHLGALIDERGYDAVIF